MNRAANTDGFFDWPRTRLGVEPQPSALHVDSDLVTKTASAFTLTLGMCDCDSAVGHGPDRMRPDGPAAGDYVDWLQSLPDHARFANRVTVVRTWNPNSTIVPAGVDWVGAGVVRVGAGALTAQLLTDLPEERLLVVDFRRPRTDG
ncbi:hypothetical protein ACX8Z9_04570 [Arthrobacter halodurans]|uniref:Uncharacterized protein n=1 Tax=Arthrobacter halodurans TaxID=516699 RepID=A0ABV4UPV2_9MICC